MHDSDSSIPISQPATRCRCLRLGILCLLGLATINGLVFWRLHNLIFEGYSDFASFYTAGAIVRNGQAARLYDLSLQWQVQEQFSSKVTIRRGPLPYVRPPFEALLFLPLSYLSYPAAFITWSILKLLLLLGVLDLLPGSRGETGTLGLHALRSLLCLAFFPVGFDLVQGQDSILLLFVLAFALRLLLRGADLSCGAVLALGLFKFHITIPMLLVFALLKRGKILLGFLTTGVLLFLISLSMVHWSGVLNYPRYLWVLNRVPGLGMVSKPESMPNVRSVMTLLLGNGPVPAAAQWFLVGIVALGVVIAAKRWRSGSSRSVFAGFSVSVVIVLLTSYYANIYDLTLLLLPLLVLGESMLESAGWPRSLFFAAFGVLFCTPFLWWLALRVNQFCWLALVLVALSISISARKKTRIANEEIREI